MLALARRVVAPSVTRSLATLSSNTHKSIALVDGGRRRLSSTLGQYLKLSKHKLTLLVVSTAAYGCYMANFALCMEQPLLVLSLIGGTTLMSASANARNQIIEVDLDSKMARTAARPMPSKRLSLQDAERFSRWTGIGGLVLLATCNPLTAVLGAITHQMYVRMYTPMKTMTPWNTAVGAVVGALPPMMGYAAVANTVFEVEPFVLFSILFLWQLPHFMALAWLYKADYKNAGYKMISAIDPTGQMTAGICISTGALLTLLPIITSHLNVTSYMFAVDGTVCNLVLMYYASNFMLHRNKSNARKLFKVTLVYLFVFLGLLVVHQSSLKSVEKLRMYCWFDQLHIPSLCPVHSHQDAQKDLNE